MTDISKCAGNGCAKRESCWRYLAPADPYRQSWMQPEVENCQYYIEVKKPKEKKDE